MFKDLRNLWTALIMLLYFFKADQDLWLKKKKKEQKGFKTLNKGNEMIYYSAYLYQINFPPKNQIVIQHQETQ